MADLMASPRGHGSGVSLLAHHDVDGRSSRPRPDVDLRVLLVPALPKSTTRVSNAIKCCREDQLDPINAARARYRSPKPHLMLGNQLMRSPRNTAISTALALALATAITGCSPLATSTETPSPTVGSTTVLQATDTDAQINTAINAMTTFPEVLDPRIWNGMTMKQDVRERTIAIVNELVASVGVKDLRIDAIDLFGSNASYEYDDSADLGVHVFTSSPTLTPEVLTPILKQISDGIARKIEGKIFFYGVPLEVTLHADRTASYQPQKGIGNYSFTKDSWVSVPTKQPNNYDKVRMLADAKFYIAKYNALIAEYEAQPRGFECGRFDELDNEMSDYRNAGFAAGSGSRSTENLTYRLLRRISVNIPDGVDTSQEECELLRDSLS